MIRVYGHANAVLGAKANHTIEIGYSIPPQYIYATEAIASLLAQVLSYNGGDSGHCGDLVGKSGFDTSACETWIRLHRARL